MFGTFLVMSETIEVVCGSVDGMSRLSTVSSSVVSLRSSWVSLIFRLTAVLSLPATPTIDSIRDEHADEATASESYKRSENKLRIGIIETCDIEHIHTHIYISRIVC